MTNFLKSVDRLGKEFMFNIEGEDSFRTSFGGVLSIIYFMGLIALFCYFGKELILKEDPNVIHRIDQTDTFSYINISDSNFFFAVSVTDNNNQLIYNRSYFDMKMVYTLYANNDLVYYKYYKYVECSKKYSSQNESIGDLNLTGYFCFDINLTIGSYWFESFALRVPTFYLKRCDKKTEDEYNITCATDAEFNENYPGTLYINYILQNFVINPQNFSEPYKKFRTLDYENYNIDKNEIYNKELYYNLANVQTDAGFIFQDVNDTLNFIEIDRMITRYGKSDYLPDHIFALQVFLSKKLSIYSRTYLRFQDVIANVGAFMDLIMFVINILFDFYLENEYSLFLYKKLFKLEVEVEKYDNDNLISLKTGERLKTIPIKFISKNSDKDFNELELNNLNTIQYNNNNIDIFENIDKPNVNSNADGNIKTIPNISVDNSFKESSNRALNINVNNKNLSRLRTLVSIKNTPKDILILILTKDVA